MKGQVSPKLCYTKVSFMSMATAKETKNQQEENNSSYVLLQKSGFLLNRKFKSLQNSGSLLAFGPNGIIIFMGYDHLIEFQLIEIVIYHLIEISLIS